MVAWEFPPAFVRCLSSQWSNKGFARVSLNLKHLFETLIGFVGGFLQSYSMHRDPFGKKGASHYSGDATSTAAP